AGCSTLAALMLVGLFQLRLQFVKRQFSLALAERERIGREIHDTLLQTVAGVAMQLNTLAKRTGAAAIGHELTQIRKILEHHIAEARFSICNLRGPSPETHSLAASLRQFVSELTNRRVGSVEFIVCGEPRTMPPDVERHLLRIGQEATRNAVRHADSSRIRV